MVFFVHVDPKQQQQQPLQKPQQLHQHTQQQESLVFVEVDVIFVVDDEMDVFVVDVKWLLLL